MYNPTFKCAMNLTYASIFSQMEAIRQFQMGCETSTFYIDMANVEHCDSAGLAWLIEIKRWGLQHNKTMKIMNMPNEVQALAEFCGVSTLLNDG